MDKPKHNPKRALRWNIILLALMMTGTTLVMAGSIIFSGLTMAENNRLDNTLGEYRATLESVTTQSADMQLQLDALRPSSPPQGPGPSANMMLLIESANCDYKALHLADMVSIGWQQIVYSCSREIQVNRTIEINNSVHITGKSARETFLRADDTVFNIFVVRSGARLRLENLTVVTGGNIAIRVDHDATLELSNCAFIGNGDDRNVPVGSSLAAIWNDGTVIIDNCEFDYNADGGGGASLYTSQIGTAYMLEQINPDRQATQE